MDAGVQVFFREVFCVEGPLEHGQGNQIGKVNPLVVARGTTASLATNVLKCHWKNHCGHMLVRGNTLLYPEGVTLISFTRQGCNPEMDTQRL